MKVVVAQKGSREHFLAARALQRRGNLAGLVTDWYAPFGGKLASLVEMINCKVLSRALLVNSNDLPRRMVKVLPFEKFRSRFESFRSRGCEAHGQSFLRSDRGFSRSVSRIKLPEHDVFFGYSYASLEALETEKAAGKLCVLDQIDPGEKEHEIICEEERKWPVYVTSPHSVCAPYFTRLRQEWALADIIIVNSQWSLNCNVAKGAPREKMEILPLAYELHNRAPTRRTLATSHTQILWLGRVTLQKGIQYLVEAARLLVEDPVEFLVCGEAAITKQAMREAPANIRWLGKVGHDEKERLYSTCSALVLPTLSDGFAITQLEAFAHGLPVIVTPNCGQVVENGVTGFIVPPRDPQTLAATVMKFVRDPELANRMASRCCEAAKAYSIDSYGRRLAQLIERYMNLRA